MPYNLNFQPLIHVDLAAYIWGTTGSSLRLSTNVLGVLGQVISFSGLESPIYKMKGLDKMIPKILF